MNDTISKNKQRKMDRVGEISQKVQKAKSIILTDYRGLTHKQLEEIKKAMGKVEGEFVITKNSLLTRALNDKNNVLSGPTAALFSYADEVSPLKELMKFIKKFTLPKIKLGFLGTVSMSEADVNNLAKLPDKQTLLAQLTGQLKAPIYGLHRSLQWNLNKLVWTLNGIKGVK